MKKNFWIKAALWSCGFGSFSDGIVVPLTNLILSDFPDTGLIMRNMVLSGGTLPALIAALVTGFALKYIDKRKVLIWGSICFLIGGIGGAFSPSIGFLVVTRIIDGVSDGILSVAAISAIVEIYRDEAQRSSVMGGYNATSALFGFITSSLAGVVAVYSWRAAFLLNGICIIGVILVIIFVPQMPPLSKTVTPTETKSVKDTFKVHFQLILFLCFGSLITQTYYLADIYVAEHDIGDSVQTGALLSVLTVANMGASAIFGYLYKKMKNIFPCFIFVTSACSLAILYFSYDFFGAAIGLALAGASNALGVVYYSMYISEHAPAAKMGNFMSFYTIVLYVNGFIAPYISTFLGKIFKQNTVGGTYIYSAIISILFALGYFISFMYNKKRTQRL